MLQTVVVSPTGSLTKTVFNAAATGKKSVSSRLGQQLPFEEQKKQQEYAKQVWHTVAGLEKYVTFFFSLGKQ